MNLNNRKQAFAQLGNFLLRYTSEENKLTDEDAGWAQLLDQAIFTAIQHNGWFTKEDIWFNLHQWGQQLQSDKLEAWLSNYSFKESEPKTVAIIMAGNIPMVGFHDFLCVLLAGHKALVKQSSKDKHLLPFVAKFLTEQEIEFKDSIEFTDEKLENFDAVIATGSNNTARYFEYYFSKKPHIIRRNRNSVAILTGEESKESLQALGEDIFRYYGLGCRNVSKLFVPQDYNFTPFFEAMYDWNPIINSHKYANNYDYNKAVYLMSEISLLENGFLILKEDATYSSPIACLFYEYYSDRDQLLERLAEDEDLIQCLVSADRDLGGLPLGKTQYPDLTDYADGVDTLKFLSKI